MRRLPPGLALASVAAQMQGRAEEQGKPDRSIRPTVTAGVADRFQARTNGEVRRGAWAAREGGSKAA